MSANMKKNPLKEKSFLFALSIVGLYKILTQKQKEYVMSKQLLRSATSVGANIREALNAQSKKDFIHKLSISQKEADESLYWLELLEASGYLNKTLYNKHMKDGTEVLKLLKSIILSSKLNSKIKPY